MKKLTLKAIQEEHNRVLCSKNYGAENKLITQCLKRYPFNNDIAIVAMKIGIVDITNSTHLSQHKKLVNIYELAEIICSIKNIDVRIKEGDPEVVNEIARANGKINLFSFASKYCCAHNFNLYGKDDYSIYDSILRDHLPEYFFGASKYKIDQWRINKDYASYNNYINQNLKFLGFNQRYIKRMFDHYIWNKYRKSA